jgi:hypothetical protein
MKTEVIHKMQATEVAEVLKRLDVIATDIQEIKLESRVFQAQTTERLESLNQKIDSVEARLTQRIDSVEAKLTQRIDSVEAKLTQRIDSLGKTVDGIETRMNAQDTRIWSLVVGVVLALFGLLAKLAFFPDVKV